MASAVEIANRALVKLGEERITAFTDPSKAARLVNSMFDIVRDAELRAHPWSFAMTRAQLPALVAAPAWGYARQYELPADFLRLVYIQDTWVADLNDYRGDDNPMFMVEGRRILTDLSAPLRIRYVSRIEDTALFDALFVEVLACRLASEMAEPLTQSNSKVQIAADKYEEAVARARRANAIEKPPVLPPDDTWVASRL
jgi:hypothetical protein